MEKIKKEDLTILNNWDTPTICNALDELIPDRSSVGFTNRQMIPLEINKSVCGYVKTARIKGSIKPGESALEIREKYYNYISQGPKPSVVVIQDIDKKRGYAAFWGEVNSAIHKGLGVEGLVTDGVVRDLDQWAKSFAALVGSVGPSHVYTHITKFNCSVNIYGMNAKDGDIIHFDKHGAVILPKKTIKKIPSIVEKQIRKEEIILKVARSANFNIRKLYSALKKSQDIH